MLLKLVSCVSGESYQGEGRGKALAEFPRRGPGAARAERGRAAWPLLEKSASVPWLLLNAVLCGRNNSRVSWSLLKFPVKSSIFECLSFLAGRTTELLLNYARAEISLRLCVFIGGADNILWLQVTL